MRHLQTNVGQLTNEAWAEMSLLNPCKEEEDESQITNQIGRFVVLDVILHRHFMDKWEDDCEVDTGIYEVGLHDMGYLLTFA